MISAEMPLAEIEPNYSGEVAERWACADGSGKIGVISSVTQAFCSTCTRARLSTDGKLYTCRDGIKAFSQWPTIPQLYVDGQFIGGCDIVREMNASGELQKLIGVQVSDRG